MAVTEQELSDAPKITLGRKQWPVPEMVARQIMRLVPAMSRAAKIDFSDLSEADMEVLFGVGYIALTRANPAMKREEYDELPIRLEELMAALPVIAKQAGLEVATAPAGEAQQAPAT